MSISAVAPSTNVLNGYSNEVGPTQAEANKQVETKAQKSTTTTHPDEWGAHGTGTYQLYTTQPTQPVLTTAQILAKEGITTTQPTTQSNFDPFFMIILPSVIVLTAFWGIIKLVMWSNRRYPPYGGFSHKHKKHHPGVPKPKLFR